MYASAVCKFFAIFQKIPLQMAFSKGKSPIRGPSRRRMGDKITGNGLSGLLAECLELLQRILEGGHSGVEGVHTAEIHTRQLQKLNRAVRAAGGEEAEIVLHGRRTLGKDTLRNADGRGDTGGILVDVESTVEMRDARPLIGDLGVRDHRDRL